MRSWANIQTIVKRELGGYFASPLAFVIIVLFLFLMGFFTFMIGFLLERREASLYWFFYWHPWLYLFLVPAIGMRLWSEERRLGTMELLLTMPITAWQAIVGKFLASWVFLALALALTFPVVITVNYLGHPDNGIIFCGYVGSFLLAGAYLAISCLTSAMTRNQVISFIVSVVVCLLFLLAGFPPVTNLISQIDTTAPLFYIPYGLITLAAVFFASYVVVTGFDIYGRKRILLSAVLTIFVGIIDVILIGVLAYRSLNQVKRYLRLVLASLCGLVFVIPIAAPWKLLFNLIHNPSALLDAVAALSVYPHFEDFQKGLLDLKSLVFFLAIIGFSLFTTGVIIRNLRSGH